MNIDTLFSSPVIMALGWSLVHSLWQGLILGLLLYFFIVAFRPESPRVLYNTVLAFMMFMMSAFIVTWIYLWHHYRIAIDLAKNTKIFPMMALTHGNPMTDFRLSGAWLEHIVGQYLPIIFVLWFLGFAVSLFNLSLDLVRVHRLKTSHVKPVSFELQSLFQQLVDRLHIKKSIQLLESPIVSIPMVIGFIKPVVLIPAGIFSGFSDKHIEAILAHELAHIIRHDYIINIFISFAGVVFYYHPVMWWMNSIVRHQREYCCDDYAVTVSQDARQYARAMLKLYENHLHIPELAMTAFKNKFSVLDRIKRITRKQVNDNEPMGWVLLVTVLLIGLFILSVNAKNVLQPKSNTETTPLVAMQPAQPDSLETSPADLSDPVSVPDQADAPAVPAKPVKVTVPEPAATPASVSKPAPEPKPNAAPKQRHRVFIYGNHDDDMHNFYSVALSDSLAKHLDSVMVNVDLRLGKLDSIWERFDGDSIRFNFDFPFAADSFHFDFPARFDSMDFDFADHYSFNYDSLFQNMQFKMDSVQVQLDFSTMMLDSLGKTLDIHIPNIEINFDSDKFRESLKHLDSIQVHLDSLNFDHLYNQKLLEMNVDSLNKDVEKRLAALQEKEHDSRYFEDMLKNQEKVLKQFENNQKMLEKLYELGPRIQEQIEKFKYGVKRDTGE